MPLFAASSLRTCVTGSLTRQKFESQRSGNRRDGWVRNPGVQCNPTTLHPGNRGIHGEDALGPWVRRGRGLEISGRAFWQNRKGAAPSRTSQICAFLHQKWPVTPTWVYRRQRVREWGGTAAMADMYQHMYICTPRQSPRNAALQLLAHTYVLLI